MARYRRRRIYRRKSGRWSANIKTIKNDSFTAQPNSTGFAVSDLCVNPVQTDSSVSQQYTVKNIELSYEIEVQPASLNDVESLTAYIMYVPQGMDVTEIYPNNHPEYIMAYRFLGSPNVEQEAAGSSGAKVNPGRLPSKIKTRMARRLQTGDKVILLITWINGSTTNPASLNFNGLIRWWTKAN